VLEVIRNMGFKEQLSSSGQRDHAVPLRPELAIVQDAGQALLPVAMRGVVCLSALLIFWVVSVQTAWTRSVPLELRAPSPSQARSVRSVSTHLCIPGNPHSSLAVWVQDRVRRCTTLCALRVPQ
jgi:hypothetical protein